jgi:chromosome segregation ATPase
MTGQTVAAMQGTINQEAANMGTLQDRIAKAEEKLKQLKAEQQKVEARKKAAEAKRTRQEETRRKVLVGAVILAKLEDGTDPETEFSAMMDAALTRAEDRKLFGLVVSDSNKQTGTELQEGISGGVAPDLTGDVQ